MNKTGSPIGMRPRIEFQVAYIRVDEQPCKLWSLQHKVHIEVPRRIVYFASAEGSVIFWRMSGIVDTVVSRHENGYGLEIVRDEGGIDPHMLVLDLRTLTDFLELWGKAEPAIA